MRLGVNICEDIWFPGPPRAAREAGAQILRGTERVALSHAAATLRRDVDARARRGKWNAVGLRQRVGGQDELVFDGASFVARSAPA